jgi:GNAT superfamily N-acetyltransferase
LVGLSVERVTTEQLDLVEPLWRELLFHHINVSPPAMPAGINPQLSWERRRAAYRRWLENAKAFALLARRDEQPVGYALVSVGGSEALDDTWDSTSEIAELQTLVVAEAARGSGVGSALLTRVEEELRSRGIEEMLIAAVATNQRAVAFYERHGYTPYLTYLYGRPGAT